MKAKINILFCMCMLALTKFELAIAEQYSSNIKYIRRLREDVRHWAKEIELAEVNHGR